MSIPSRGALSALIAAAAAFAAAAAPVAVQARETVVDAARGFRLDTPAGWTRNVDQQDAETVLVVSPPGDAFVAVCNVYVGVVPEMATMTPAQIDAQMAAGEAAGTMFGELKAIDPAAAVIYENVVDRDGHKALAAEGTLYVNGVQMHARKIVLLKPGKAYNLNCLTTEADNIGLKKTLDPVFASFHLIP